MEALKGSCSKLIPHKFGNGSLACERDGVLGRSEFRSLKLPQPNLNFSLSISLTQKPISLVSSLSSSHTHVEIEDRELKSEELQNNDTSHGKTVHVRFQLQRECSFGQRFLIVGDDPIFGMWNPENAVPMNWSDGHVWTVELDIPVGKSIKFKLIMKESAKEIVWQPGPDRILETLEAEKKLSICVDWDSAEFQKMIVEDPIYQVEDSSPDSEMQIVAENLAAMVEAGESTNTSGVSDVMERSSVDKPKAFVAENISEAKEVSQGKAINPVKEKENKKGARVLGKNGQFVNAKNSSSIKTGGNLASYEGVPVLVPGLSPLPKASAREELVNEAKPNANADGDTKEAIVPSFQADIAEELKSPENTVDENQLYVKDEHNTMLHLNDRTEARLDDENKHQETPQIIGEKQDQPETNNLDDMVDNDIQWGKKTWQNLLKSLGIQEYFA